MSTMFGPRADGMTVSGTGLRGQAIVLTRNDVELRYELDEFFTVSWWECAGCRLWQGKTWSCPEPADFLLHLAEHLGEGDVIREHHVEHVLDHTFPGTA